MSATAEREREQAGGEKREQVPLRLWFCGAAAYRPSSEPSASSQPCALSGLSDTLKLLLSCQPIMFQFTVLLFFCLA